MNTKSLLIIIPARGGSKRIPHKNIKEICGQPMIYWPLMELSKKFSSNQILISTDSLDVITCVEKKGIKVPFIRPDSLSDDFTGTTPVATHALAWFEQNVAIVNYVLIIYPTAVFLDINDISSAFSLLKQDAECSLVMSATNFSFPIQRAVFQNNKGYAEMFEPENALIRSQDLPEAMHDAGQFYWAKASSWAARKSIFEGKVAGILLPRSRVQDIDTPEDWELAEVMFRTLGLG